MRFCKNPLTNPNSFSKLESLFLTNVFPFGNACGSHVVLRIDATDLRPIANIQIFVCYTKCLHTCVQVELRADWNVTSRHGFLSKKNIEEHVLTSNVILDKTRSWGWRSIKSNECATGGVLQWLLNMAFTWKIDIRSDQSVG